MLGDEIIRQWRNYTLWRNCFSCLTFKPVFLIHNVLIRICGFLPLGYGSCSFLSGFHDANKKEVSFQKIFSLWYPTFRSFFKDKKLLKNHKAVEIKSFLNFLACWWKVPHPGPVQEYCFIHWLNLKLPYLVYTEIPICL